MKGLTVSSPPSGSSVKVNLVSPGVIIAPSGPLAEVTLIFPTTATDGQIMSITFTQDVAKLTFTNSNFAHMSVIGPAVHAGDGVTLVFHGETNKWYRTLV